MNVKQDRTTITWTYIKYTKRPHTKHPIFPKYYFHQNPLTKNLSITQDQIKNGGQTSYCGGRRLRIQTRDWYGLDKVINAVSLPLYLRSTWSMGPKSIRVLSD